MIEIDGSHGEGGGQVLRTALALSLATRTPFRIDRIRARREKPGLMHQHLTAVQAAARVGSAEVGGAALGSTSLSFSPGRARAGDYTFDVGTAGSTTLVLQTVLPPLLLASEPSTLRLQGGTHNPWAPPYDFLERSFLPLVSRMGPHLTATLEQRGFAPAGGGRFTIRIEPAAKLAHLELLERGALRATRATAIVASLPVDIARRELAVISEALKLGPTQTRVIDDMNAHGPGNAALIEIESEHVTEVITGFGRKGLRAELLADDMCAEAQRYLATDVPVGEHLADQLLLPIALAGGGTFRTLPLSGHAATNVDVIRMFLDVRIDVERESDVSCRVTIAST